jgi:hypothetical protein
MVEWALDSVDQQILHGDVVECIGEPIAEPLGGHRLGTELRSKPSPQRPPSPDGEVPQRCRPRQRCNHRRLVHVGLGCRGAECPIAGILDEHLARPGAIRGIGGLTQTQLRGRPQLADSQERALRHLKQLPQAGSDRR